VLFLALLGGLGYLAGRLVSFLAAAYVTWQINRRFAFRGSRKEKSHGQWWRYLAVMALGGGLISLSTALSFTCLATAPFLYCWPPRWIGRSDGHEFLRGEMVGLQVTDEIRSNPGPLFIARR